MGVGAGGLTSGLGLLVWVGGPRFAPKVLSCWAVAGLGWAYGAGLGWAGLGWAGLGFGLSWVGWAGAGLWQLGLGTGLLRVGLG